MRRLLFAACLLCAALAPPNLGAQERATLPRQLVEDKQRTYDAAKQQNEADSVAFQTIVYEWDQLLERRGTAKARGEDSEVERISGQLEELTGEKRRLRVKWRDARDDWIDAGESLLDALNGYLGMLDNQIQSFTSGTDDELSDLYDEYEARLDSLELELPLEEPELLPMPTVVYRPGDGPREIRNKRSLLEKRVQDLTDILAEVDEDIEVLVVRQFRRQRRDRDKEDANMFGDDEIPTGGNRTNLTGDAAASDSTTVALALMPLEDRIAAKRAYREDVEEMLAAVQQQLEDFEREVRIGR
ncbi:MAG: hypothetical protein F4139_14300 [Gemmatimonadetes bacterium]|nr:hypothetical protein [Gemmatimonadota bacterium]MYA64384.1 hypothetical protein [Gemmatimonadota bacterium]MYB98621.1 hypothetical protein [Gemmatimonadota bacterium]MYH54091.1 hypothetical protein [Gemmatimonadota bacterium]MYI46635.1 hypothetical protein [Gemmatimonadota bacterium]